MTPPLKYGTSADTVKLLWSVGSGITLIDTRVEFTWITLEEELSAAGFISSWFVLKAYYQIKQ